MSWTVRTDLTCLSEVSEKVNFMFQVAVQGGNAMQRVLFPLRSGLVDVALATRFSFTCCVTPLWTLTCMGYPCHMVGALALSIEECLRRHGNETQSVSGRRVLRTPPPLLSERGVLQVTN